ncbi:MAG: phosphate ABC transporter substrate-binding protein PstS [Gammaproteobacteria bacterium]
MKRLLSLLFIFTVMGSANANITGAGASFPAPLYGKWAEAYNAETGIEVNYQSIGSSAGVNQIKAKTVDFGATDSPLKDEELTANHLIQFPTVIGGVVPVVNIEGVKPGDITLTGEILGNIYLGKITKWNDPALAALNPNLKLPDQKITVVRRADGSGTTFIFTEYLSKVNTTWKDKVGSANTVNWPLGTGGKGNEGVAAFVGRLKGSIGYVEYAYAKQNNMTYAQMQNAAGKIVAPNADTFAAAVNNVDWSKSFAQSLTNQTADNAWPMTATTFVLVHNTPEQKEKTQAVLKFFGWAYEKGGDAARNLDYVPLPADLIAKITASWPKE